jgi:hypothetical protein
LRHLIFISLILVTTTGVGQITSFNQYNACSGDINPAYLACISSGQASLLARDQAPGYRFGLVCGEANVNDLFRTINSSIGLSALYVNNPQGGFNNTSYGFQYAYRVIFLETYYLCLGASINLNTTEIDVNNYHYLYEPKASYNDLTPNTLNNQAVQGSFGLVLVRPYQVEYEYMGLSIRNVALSDVSSTHGFSLQQGKTFSIQALRRVDLTRYSLLLPFVCYEYTGGTTYGTNDSAKTTLQKAYSYLLVEGNIFSNKHYLFGLGYKFFSGNYSTLVYRVAYFTGKYTFGYSFDTNPFIQNDVIKFCPSNEFYIQVKFKN